MEFGDRTRFAIAFELDQNPGGPWLFGRFCYWIDSKIIGDFDAGTSLRDVLFQMRYVVGDRGRRLYPRLSALPADTIFHLISTSLNETSDDILQYVSEDFLPARLDVRIPIDIFNLWDIFLVEGVDEAKLVYCETGSPNIEVMTLLPGEFDTVVESAHACLDRIYNASARDA